MWKIGSINIIECRLAGATINISSWWYLWLLIIFRKKYECLLPHRRTTIISHVNQLLNYDDDDDDDRAKKIEKNRESKNHFGAISQLKRVNFIIHCYKQRSALSNPHTVSQHSAYSHRLKAKCRPMCIFSLHLQYKRSSKMRNEQIYRRWIFIWHEISLFPNKAINEGSLSFLLASITLPHYRTLIPKTESYINLHIIILRFKWLRAILSRSHAIYNIQIQPIATNEHAFSIPLSLSFSYLYTSLLLGPVCFCSCSLFLLLLLWLWSLFVKNS